MALNIRSVTILGWALKGYVGVFVKVLCTMVYFEHLGKLAHFSSPILKLVMEKWDEFSQICSLLSVILEIFTTGCHSY